MLGSRFLGSFVVAGQGIAHAVRTGRNLQVQLGAGVSAVVVGIAVQLAATEWACLFLAMGLVITAELLNSAIETAVDLVTLDVHPLAKITKDVAAGAALVSSLTAVGVGAAVIGPHLLA